MQDINIKKRLKEIIDDQPNDATFDDILRELAFERMIERGLDYSKNRHSISNEEMEHRIKTW